MATNYIQVLGEFFPSSQATVASGADPTVYANLTWITTAIPQATLDSYASRAVTPSGTGIPSTLVPTVNNFTRPVYNATGSTIAAGTPVYVTGTDSTTGRADVAPADASNSAKMPAIGVVSAAIAASTGGLVYIAGEVDNLNTSSWTDGQALYVAAGGGLTNAAPTGTNLIQQVGQVIISDASVGQIEILAAGVAQLPNLASGSTWVGNGSGVPTAQAAVTSVSGRTGAVSLTKTDVGLANVVNSLQVINNGNAPSLQEGTQAGSPAAGNTGAIYITTDTLAIYRDNGTSWDLVKPAQTGDVSSPAGSGVTTLATVATAGTNTKVTYNAKGLVTSGTTPTTLAGYSITDALNLAGGTMTGNIVMSGGSTITGLPTPSNANQAVPKSYVDTLIQGIVWRNPILDPNLVGIVTAEPGSPVAGTTYLAYGGTYPQTWTGSVTVNSLSIVSRTYGGLWVVLKTLAAGDRLGLGIDTGTPDASLTGISVNSHALQKSDLIQYVSGSPLLAAAWTLPEGQVGVAATMSNGVTVVVDVTEGSPNSGHTYSFNLAANNWIEVAGPGAITAGNGLAFTGNVLNVNPTARLTFTTSQLDLATVATAGTYKSVTVDVYGRVTSGSNPTTLAGYGITDAVQNAGSTPSIQAAALASQPAAGTAGRLFVSTDTFTLYRDNGTSWNIISPAYTGDATKTAGGTALTLATVNSNIGTFNNVTVNAKGLVTAASTVAYLTGNQTITLSGDATGSGTTAITTTLATVNSNTGAFGSTTVVPVITVNGKGLTTAVSTANIAFPVTSVAGKTGAVTLVNSDVGLGSVTNALQVINAGGIPSIFEGTAAPASPSTGELFVNTSALNIQYWTGAAWTTIAAPGTVTSIGASTTSTGLTIGSSPVTTSGTITFTLNAELTALAGLASTGLVARTAAGTYTPRTITSSGSTITVTNGSGVGGNPNVDLPNVGTPVTASFVKITTDAQGRVSATTAAGSSDITTALGYTPINKAGDTVTGTLTFPNSAGTTITGIPNPVNSTDVANKAYVDATTQGLDVKASAWVATTANVAIATAPATIDGITLSSGQRVLVKNQTLPAQNGIYVFNGAGVAMTRAVDMSTGTTFSGSFIYVENGTANGTTQWILSTPDPITLGTTAQTWIQFGGAGTYTAGTGLSLSGTTFSLSTPVAIANGGTNLSTIGSANQILGVNAGATALEYKTVSTGTGISYVNAAGSVTITNTGVTSIVAGSNVTVSGATGAVTINATGTVTSVAATTSSTGLAITGSPITSSGTLTFTLNGELQALAGLAGTGIIARTAAGAYSPRTITAGTGITITNGDGVSGNPTIAITSPIAISLGGTNATTASAAFTNLSPLTTKGDIIGYSTLPVRIGVGTNGQSLVADSTSSTGLTWKTISVPGSGRIIQSIFSSINALSGTTTWASTGGTAPASTEGTLVFSQAITPSNATSTVRIQASIVVSGTNSNMPMAVAVFRGTTCVGGATITTPNNNNGTTAHFTFYDAPATTSATTYVCRIAKLSGSGTWYVNSTPSGLWASVLDNNAYTIEEILAN